MTGMVELDPTTCDKGGVLSRGKMPRLGVTIHLASVLVQLLEKLSVSS